MALEKRLFLLDAYALIFRGYYAFIKNPRINSKGMKYFCNYGVYEFSIGCYQPRETRIFGCCF